jgi:HEAT repeat protein
VRNGNETSGVRGQAAEAIGYLCQFRPNPEAFRQLMTTLSDSSVEVRFWSAFALGLIGNSKAIPELRRLVDNDKGVLDGWWGVGKEAQDAIQQIKKRVSQRTRAREKPSKGASRDSELKS